MVVCDRGPSLSVTSRTPDDLPAFWRAMVDAFAGERESTGRGRLAQPDRPARPTVTLVGVTESSVFVLESGFADHLLELAAPWEPSPAPDPRLAVLNADLAVELGLDLDSLRGPDGLAVLSGSAAPAGSTPVAQGYAGHQFGGYSPRLGDGRAVLLGELVERSGRRVDLHLKGSGRTLFSRGGDGKAVLGPMLREHLFGEAMHALGIPTTRSLAVVATGEHVQREEMLPGAVLARVAASHLRVGTFQYAAASGDRDLLQRLTDHAIARHHPSAAEAERPALALLAGVVGAQASVVAQWMLVGFVHGVMNTDNSTISGETIDYGPCAFMDAYDPATVFSSIDHGGRYAFGQQPAIAQWNLARLAEALLPLIDDDADRAVERATEVLRTYADRYRLHWSAGMRAKLGLTPTPGGADAEAAEALVADLLALLHEQRVDFTMAFRSLSNVVRGDPAPTRALFQDPAAFDAWSRRWSECLTRDGVDPSECASAMDQVNPVYVPRNHLVEESLAAAHAGDLGPFERLLEILGEPFVERADHERYAAPSPPELGPYQTFCGT